MLEDCKAAYELPSETDRAQAIMWIDEHGKGHMEIKGTAGDLSTLALQLLARVERETLQ